MKRFLLFAYLMGLIQILCAQTNPAAPGRLIDIGGYHLHIDIRGKGRPVVVLIAGSEAFSLDWALVMPKVSQFTTVCSYDRPGLAWSDPGPLPGSFDQDVYELHSLLEKAGLAPPYILVGHSIGGIIARFFERKYPDETKGLVLVDATSEDTKLFINGKIQRLRLLSQGRAIPPVKKRPDTLTKIPSGKELEEIQKMVGQPKTESPFDKLPIEQ
jgi:pimeloyl-ACP methyl ester carboxylesterase